MGEPQFSAPSNQAPVEVPPRACQKPCRRTAQGAWTNTLLSLHHNWNTKSLRRNCWNLSLMITETSTTLSRLRSTRKFFLLPLFLSPRLTGEVAGPLAPCIGLSRIELFLIQLWHFQCRIEDVTFVFALRQLPRTVQEVHLKV